MQEEHGGNCGQGRSNLWAPWRVEYIQGLSEGGGCFICRDLEAPEDDDKNLVLWRSAKSIVILNRFPYNNGHTLILPNRHVKDLKDMTKDERADLFDLLVYVQELMGEVLKPVGYNVGMNLGRLAGAGFPGHLHIHVVPRWKGDVNFMPVLSDTKVISQSLKELCSRLRAAHSKRKDKKKTVAKRK